MKTKPLKAAAFDGSPANDAGDKHYTVVISEQAAEMLSFPVRLTVRPCDRTL
jgi:hypothetical protein